MFLLPSISVIAESLLAKNPAPFMVLVGKWFVFWGIGGRLGSAGVRQILQPGFTAKDIFNIKDTKAFVVVQELGFANLCMGIAAIWSLFKPEWVLPVALIGGLYYGVAGAMHVFSKSRNFNENLAMYSDLAIFIIFLIYFVDQI